MSIRMRNLGLSLCLTFAGALAYAQSAEVPTDVAQLVEKFNEDEIPFNDNLLVLGKPEAPASVVFLLGLSGQSSFLVSRGLEDLIEKYVDTGKIRLIVIDMPLTWHDMQAFAGFRCVPPEKHWDVLKRALRYPRDAMNMKNGSIESAPGYIWSMMKGYDVSREQAEKCMRNTRIAGFIEGQRRVAYETWGTGVAPSFIVGNQVLVEPSNMNFVISAVETMLKGAQ